MEQFKNGDVVILKSGSPLMTIADISHGEGIAKCFWFDKKNVKKVDYFPHESLMKPPSEPSVTLK